jgi:5-methyltetrahydrofolate--homocysteine methyltransferase
MRCHDIVLLDGALGTCLWEKADNKVPVWRYNIENPGIVAELAREYAEAGARIVMTNSFGANRLSMKRTDYTVRQIVSTAVGLTKDAVGDKAMVGLDVGPLPVLLEPYGDLSEEEAFELFDEQISSGIPEKPDVIVLETFMDADMLRIAVQAAAKHDLPVFATMTFTEAGKTIMGHSVERFVDTVKDLPVDAVGINCSLGPEKAVSVIASFRQYTDLPLIFKPNAGKPILQDGEETVQFDIDTFVADCMPALEYDVKYIGGCCGSNPSYIRALSKTIFGK